MYSFLAFLFLVANSHSLHSLISANLKSTVYCYAIAEGGEEEWNFAWHRYLESNVASEKNRLLSAMGCTKHVWILSRSGMLFGFSHMALTDASGFDTTNLTYSQYSFPASVYTIYIHQLSFL